MFDSIKRKWYFSSLRFYYLNAKWNYNFWLKCTREYKTLEYYHFSNLKEEPQKLSKLRFIGYKFNNTIYIDNPGFPIKDRELWKCWKKKGLI